MTDKNGEWIVTGCTLHDSVNVEYCKTSCRINKHCKVFLATQNIKEKVQFT